MDRSYEQLSYLFLDSPQLLYEQLLFYLIEAPEHFSEYIQDHENRWLRAFFIPHGNHLYTWSMQWMGMKLLSQNPSLTKILVLYEDNRHPNSLIIPETSSFPLMLGKSLSVDMDFYAKFQRDVLIADDAIFEQDQIRSMLPFIRITKEWESVIPLWISRDYSRQALLDSLLSLYRHDSSLWIIFSSILSENLSYEKVLSHDTSLFEQIEAGYLASPWIQEHTMLSLATWFSDMLWQEFTQYYYTTSADMTGEKEEVSSYAVCGI